MALRVTRDWQSYALDLVAVGGISSIVYGVHLIYTPAAYIVGGLLAAGLAALKTWTNA